MTMLRVGTGRMPVASGREFKVCSTFEAAGCIVRMPGRLTPTSKLGTRIPWRNFTRWFKASSLPAASNPRESYAAFNKAWPGWTDLSFNSQDRFPWVVVSYAAFLAQDRARLDRYVETIRDRYLITDPVFAWPWYSAEAGWLMRVDAEIE